MLRSRAAGRPACRRTRGPASPTRRAGTWRSCPRARWRASTRRTRRTSRCAETSRPERSAYRVDELGRDGQAIARSNAGALATPSGIVPSGPGWKIIAQARSTSGSPIDAISQSTTASRSGGAARRTARCRACSRRGTSAGAWSGGTVSPQPVARRRAAGSGRPTVRLELRQPAPDLAFEVGPGVGDVAETARLPVDGVDRRRVRRRAPRSARRAVSGARRPRSGTLLRTGTPSMRSIT